MKSSWFRNILSVSVAASLLAASPVLAQSGGTSLSGKVQRGTNVAPSISAPGSTGTGIYFNSDVGLTGHIESGVGSAFTPVLSACGTTPTLATGSSDTAGTVTMGTTATGCVITFGTAYTSAPTCQVNWQATPLASQSYTVSATAITTVQTSTSNNVLNYTCTAKTGG